MKKWEVMACPIDPKDIQLKEKTADPIIEMGMDGWELVTVVKEKTGNVGYFKRPIEENEQKEEESGAPETDLDLLVSGLNQWSTDFENFRKTLGLEVTEEQALELFKESLERK
tara:strand:+ start:867 stop:1205 length:339 start_codon:yes stop_codon:yes gene_type:complete